MGHIVVMTSTASIGLMSLFLVDLADMYFLSLLGEVELASAIGYAGSILFFTTSICIGLAIAMSALVSRSLGKRRKQRAKRHAINISIYSILLSVIVAAVVWALVPWLLTLLGAVGRAHALAEAYLRIIVPSMPLLALAMGLSGVLRAHGDAKRAMFVTVVGGLVNAVLDPILIFGLNLGIEGAAWASVASRVAAFWMALKAVLFVHRALCRFRFRLFWPLAATITLIAGPAILTNVATPIGNAYVTAAVAEFGDSAVAGLSIIGRIIPVAFGVIFALSGAVGPIIGQNYGAEAYGRVRRSFTDALLFAGGYVLVMALLLFLLQDVVIGAFQASGEAAALISLFCTWLAVPFIFNAALFVANAGFNNLGRPIYSTFFNFGRATFGTIPFVYLGAQWGGAAGVMIGQTLGASLFGVLALWIGYRLVRRLECGDAARVDLPPEKRRSWPVPLWPQTTQRG